MIGTIVLQLCLHVPQEYEEQRLQMLSKCTKQLFCNLCLVTDRPIANCKTSAVNCTDSFIARQLHYPQMTHTVYTHKPECGTTPATGPSVEYYYYTNVTTLQNTYTVYTCNIVHLHTHKPECRVPPATAHSGTYNTPELRCMICA